MKFTTSIILSTASLLAAIPRHVEAHGKLVNPEGVNVQLQQGVPLTSQADVTRNRAGQPEAPCGRFDNGRGQEMSLAGMDMTPRMMLTPGQPAQLQWFQQNGDGAGPLVAAIDPTGTGQSFQNVPITQNIPGQQGRNRGTSRQTLDVAIDIPQNLQCTGPNGACLLKLTNPLGFVSCAPVGVQGGAAAPQKRQYDDDEEPLAKRQYDDDEEPLTKRQYDDDEEPLTKRQYDDDEEPLAKRQYDDDEEPLAKRQYDDDEEPLTKRQDDDDEE
ncbi:hypothetical protein HK102_005807 [Quaeritorhiza haematococci]|nr:hypothetical protein HK102_005807 [Quaeritorhiza haematococci]